jgi:flagellin
MIINHNIPALNTYRSLTINQQNTTNSLAKLSSGLRINTAGDDAAGLAISEKMRSQIRGLDQASRNAYDGKSLLNVAEGALNEVHSILQRMKELAVQSANDTNTRFDRGEIQKEVDQLKTEIDRISRDTEFNTMKLLNGTMENRATVINVETNLTTTENKTLRGTFRDSSFGFEIGGAIVEAGAYSLTSSLELTATTARAVDIKSIGNGIKQSDNEVGDTAPTIKFLNFTTLTGGGTGLGAKYGDYRLDISGNLGGTYDLTLTGPDGKYEILKAQGSTATAVFKEIGVVFDFTGTSSITGDGYITFTNAFTDGTFTLKSKENGTTLNLKIGAGQAIQTYTGQTLNIGGIQFELSVGLFTGNYANGTGVVANIDVIDNSIKLHIGANQGQNMGVSILDSSAKALGVNKVDLREQKTADVAITVIDEAINRVSSERSKMGAIINRLDHTIKNLGTTSENLTASESRIRDTDMAKEIMDFTKNNILSQAAQSMLAQANALPQGVLSLLR